MTETSVGAGMRVSKDLFVFSQRVRELLGRMKCLKITITDPLCLTRNEK